MNVLKKIGKIAASVILWMVILLAALFAFTTLAQRNSANVASIAGFSPMVVQSNSMAPTFNQGDLIFVKKTDTTKLEVGDVITFHTIIENEYVLNTHRIESIAGEGEVRSYTTKGDNNAIQDTHVISDGDIVGKYVGRIPNMGKVIDFLSGSVGFLVVIVLPMLLFFIYQVYHLIMISINLKKAVAAEDAQKQSSELDEAAKAKAEAQAALEEAKRLKEEAEATLLKANQTKDDNEG